MWCFEWFTVRLTEDFEFHSDTPKSVKKSYWRQNDEAYKESEFWKDEKPGWEQCDTGAKKFWESIISRKETVDEEVMDECSIAQHFVRLPEAKTSREKFHRPPISLLLLHPHPWKTLTATYFSAENYSQRR